MKLTTDQYCHRNCYFWNTFVSMFVAINLRAVLLTTPIDLYIYSYLFAAIFCYFSSVAR